MAIEEADAQVLIWLSALQYSRERERRGWSFEKGKKYMKDLSKKY